MGDRAGRWLRVSTGNQDEGNQVPDVDAWCDSHGYDVTQTYVLHGKSAFKGSKKFDQTWAQVLSDMRSGKITVLVVWKTDRMDRKLNTIQMIKEAVDAGGRIEFVTQPHLNDLSTMGGRIALKVQEEIAHEESKIKSDRIIAEHEKLRRKGSVIGRAPYGCRIEFRNGIKVLAPVPAEAAVIRDAAAWYLSGMTLDAICERLNNAGRLPRMMRNGHQPTWTAKTLSGALRNEAVAGRRRNGDGFTVKPQAILDRAMYERVIGRMTVRSSRKGISQSKTPALLTSVIRCGKCDRNMYRTGEAPWQGYYCRVKGCGSFVKVADADAFVRDAMARVQSRDLVETVVPGRNRDEAIAEVKRDMSDAVQAEDFAKLVTLKAEIERLRSLPAEPSRVVRHESKVTVAAMWQALSDDSARRAFLIERQATITVHDGKRLVFAGPFILKTQPEALPVAA